MMSDGDNPLQSADEGGVVKRAKRVSPFADPVKYPTPLRILYNWLQSNRGEFDGFLADCPAEMLVFDDWAMSRLRLISPKINAWANPCCYYARLRADGPQARDFTNYLDEMMKDDRKKKIIAFQFRRETTVVNPVTCVGLLVNLRRGNKSRPGVLTFVPQVMLSSSKYTFVPHHEAKKGVDLFSGLEHIAQADIASFLAPMPDSSKGFLVWGSVVDGVSNRPRKRGEKKGREEEPDSDWSPSDSDDDMDANTPQNTSPWAGDSKKRVNASSQGLKNTPKPSASTGNGKPSSKAAGCGPSKNSVNSAPGVAGSGLSSGKAKPVGGTGPVLTLSNTALTERPKDFGVGSLPASTSQRLGTTVSRAVDVSGAVSSKSLVETSVDDLKEICLEAMRQLRKRSKNGQGKVFQDVLKQLSLVEKPVEPAPPPVPPPVLVVAPDVYLGVPHVEKARIIASGIRDTLRGKEVKLYPFLRDDEKDPDSSLFFPDSFYNLKLLCGVPKKKEPEDFFLEILNLLEDSLLVWIWMCHIRRFNTTIRTNKKAKPSFEQNVAMALDAMHDVLCLVYQYGTDVLKSGCIFDVATRSFKQLGNFHGYVASAPAELRAFHQKCFREVKELKWPVSASARLLYLKVRNHPLFLKWITDRRKTDLVRQWYDRDQEQDPGPIQHVLLSEENRQVVANAIVLPLDGWDKEEQVVFEANPGLILM